MTDQELAQEVASRLWAEEAKCQVVIDDPKAHRFHKAQARQRLAQLKRAHRLLERAQSILLASGDMVQPLSGGGPKPPQVP
jgi:methylphosphotriester-DNA--protein-cysteine methyltransferase